MLRRGFQPSRLGAALVAALVAMISLTSGAWILLFADLSSVIFRQSAVGYIVMHDINIEEETKCENFIFILVTLL